MKKLLAGAIAAAIACGSTAFAQEKYPNKPIRMIVGYAPGGGSDIMGRLIAPQITEALGQQVIVENRAGQAQNIAAEFIVRQPADGYTLFLSSAALGVNATLYPKLNYDPVKDFIPVAVFASSANLLMTHPSVPVKNVKEFLALVKKSSSKMNYSSSGSGSTQHLSGEMLKLLVKGEFTHIPYKGIGPATAAQLGNEVQLAFTPVLVGMPHMKAGRLKAIASGAPKRSAAVPDVPTVAEAGGLAGFDVSGWWGLLGPAKLPRPIVDLLNASVRRILDDADVRRNLLSQGMDPSPSTPEAFAALIRDDMTVWGDLGRKLGIKLD
jgi:tripartite-type tricarboxylate transporter receptor subunit TctC